MSKQSRRDQLLDAALAECVDNGYAAVGVKEITARASVSHGTFYNYFENRRQMLDVLIDRETDGYLEVLRQAEAEMTRPVTEESLRSQVALVTAELLRIALARVDVAAFLLLDVAGIDAQALAGQVERYRESGRLATAILANAGADGLIDESVSLEFAGQAWISTVLAVIAPAVADGRDIGDIDEAARILTDALLHGVPEPSGGSAQATAES
ncbi:putative TetR family transcriptional regulator [Gordonia araii NBRC 100433]|uniref:Putative TetR family transcriptional regulator n=1 Tax=Gordonia araii NBRC 100433 TaxID=1073574 RepID=G7GXZ6_9ACTN|nr:TetR/AcrR family transcriptional regulator [Gordonia araii]NNG98083.1 TetR/AcrR family transcriptional regulator [Gordonia araii NBRC 100433]GAB08471.1 putative TetR family transcriptional regulator [Gordonia araii NBRC 100433]